MIVEKIIPNAEYYNQWMFFLGCKANPSPITMEDGKSFIWKKFDTKENKDHTGLDDLWIGVYTYTPV